MHEATNSSKGMAYRNRCGSDNDNVVKRWIEASSNENDVKKNKRNYASDKSTIEGEVKGPHKALWILN